MDDFKIKRIGEVFHTNSGVDVEIIEYVNSKNITIKWLDDGTIQPGCRYNHLQTGKIRKKENRVGQCQKQNCGLNATIIEYIDSHNIVIEFEDGCVLKNKYYRDFKMGLIKHPEISTAQYAVYKEPLTEKGRVQNMGQSIVNKNGQVMTIIEYRSYEDIDVQFEDGTIVQHQRIDQFREKRIVNPNNKMVANTSFNEFTMMYYLKQIGFSTYKMGELKDVGFQNYSLDAFNADIKLGVEYDGEIHSFRRNCDEEKDKLCKNLGIELIRIREKMDKTSFATCFRLNNQKHFSKEFEDILKQLSLYLNKQYSLPLLNIDFEKDADTIMTLFETEYTMPHIGEEYVSNYGDHVIVTRYMGANDVWVSFDDGYVKKVSIRNLKKGSFCRYGKKEFKEMRTNESKRMNNGMMATIIEYRNANNIDIQFEDGFIVRHRKYSHFKNGEISYPKKSV